MAKKSQSSEASVRVNTTVKGEPARWILEWKRRGLFSSNTDAVVQALRTLRREMIERDLKEQQLEKESGDERR